MDNRTKIKRYRFLVKVNQYTEIPLIVLGLIWLVLLIIELVWQLTPLLETAALVIWGIFIADFIIKFILAPKKGSFLSKNVITMLSLIVPAFRVFRIFIGLRFLRSLGFIRSLRVIRIVGSFNRAMRILGNTLERRAFGYVLLLTFTVCFVGSAAMYAFEKQHEGFESYWESLWWTAMLLTSVGSEHWPQTVEGRTICFLLSVYSLGVLGYLTAVLASFFIGQDKLNTSNAPAGTDQKDLLEQIRLLNNELAERKGRQE